MKTVERHFRNVISHMNKATMLDYMERVLNEQDLRSILSYLNVHKKGEILNRKMDDSISKIGGMMANLAEKFAENNVNCLRKLEGRIALLIISRKIAESKKNRAIISETTNQINVLLKEYKKAGGQATF